MTASMRTTERSTRFVSPLSCSSGSGASRSARSALRVLRAESALRVELVLPAELPGNERQITCWHPRAHNPVGVASQ